MPTHTLTLNRNLRAVLATLTVSLSLGLQAQTAFSPALSSSTLSAAPVTGTSLAATPTTSTAAPLTLAPKGTAPSAVPAKPSTGNDPAAKNILSPDDAAKPDNAKGAEPVKNTAADEVEFQRFVRQSTGQSLGLYGYELFDRGGFGSVQAATVPAGYVMGPGDELVLQAYGVFDLSERVTIDREGRITLPKAGPLTMAGIPFSDAEKVITAHLSKIYKNFTLSVTMGRLRSVEIFVVGQARRPGKHLVSSLSSVINALFETGGPSANGSLRAVELRRAGKTIATVDLYQFLSQGNNTGDARLLNGDLIYIPPAGPRAAVLGTVNAPAIYELAPGETIQNILALTGGLPTLAAPQKAQLERVNVSNVIARYVEDFALNSLGLAKPLQAGDILTVFQISPQIANVVTLEGNVAAPMRYTFKPGMRVSDLLSDKRLLIPGSYWLQLNLGNNTGNYSRPEVNLDYAVIQRLDVNNLRTRLLAFNLGKAVAKDPKEDLLLQSGDIVTVYKPGQPGAMTEDSITITGEVVGGTQRFVWRPGFSIQDIIPNAQWLIDYYNYWQRASGNNLKNNINWDYAQVIRRKPATLESYAITFNLGDAVLRNQPASNVALQPGDQISLFTTQQLAVPIEKRTRLVTLSGEVAVPGVYQAAAGETLPQLIRRIGGLTPQAYVFGTEFNRESVRLRQQENLDTLTRRLEAQSQTQASSVVANRGADAAQAQLLQQQQQAQLKSQIERLKSLKSNGRMALELDPQGQSLATLPPLPLEDGDRILIPATPGFVSAFGSVNNENVFIYKSGKSVGDVLKSAGLTEDSEPNQAFVLRADGSIIAKRDSGGLFGASFESLQVMPGDTVVVPAMIDRESRYNFIIRAAKDWTSILANFGLGAAAIKTLSK
jgi:protein involved in polysaccharide export with SLBB domain